MNLRFFIDRPVFSGVISVVIVLMGLIAIKVLPVEQYPDIAPPTVNVFCTYPGANAETVQKAVIVPLEEAINGVEDMIYMTSTASNTGDASINIYFKQGANGSVVILGGLSLVNSLHAYTFASLKRKKLISTTPLNDALNALILALNASAAAFVLLFTKKFRILS